MTISIATPLNHSVAKALNNEKKNGNIQILRGLAALWVVIYHCSFMMINHIDELSAFGRFMFHGFVGVDIFFIISGYIISASLDKINVADRLAWKDFAIRRVIRIAPMYYIVTLVFSIFIFLYPHLFKTSKIDLESLVFSLAFWPHYNWQGNIYPILGVGWTLNYEIFFYISSALFGWLFHKKGIPIMAGSFLLLAILGSIFSTQKNAAIATYTNPIILEFCFGCLIFRLNKCRMANGKVLFILAITSGLFLSTLNWPQDGWYRVIAFGIPSFLLVYSATCSSPWKIFPSKALLYIGDISYSMYLIHQLTIVAIAKLLMPYWELSALNTSLYFVTSLAVVIIFSSIVYRIERGSYRILSTALLSK